MCKMLNDSNSTMITVQQSYRLSPDTIFKLKLISISADISLSHLIELMVDDLWEKKKDEISTKITSHQVNKEARRILHKTGKG